MRREADTQPAGGQPRDTQPAGGQSADARSSVGATPRAPHERVPAPGQRTPDFFIVGHPKCGTTALYAMLRGHPEIFMPDVKEPRHFATDLRSRLPARAPEATALHTLDGYLELFAPARPEQLAGEASPEYLRSRVAAANIASVQPDARIIAILREPAAFLRSFHLQMVSSNVESQRDLRKAMALEPRRRAGSQIPRRCHHPESLMYSEHVRYVEQLNRFHDVFAAENILVLIYDDFRADNEATVARVLRFLGVDDALPVATVETKQLKAVRSMGLHRLANAARVARTRPGAATGLGRTVNALTPAPLRSERAKALWRQLVYRTPAPPDEQFVLELRSRFKGEVVALSEYLDRDLVALWGYEGLG